MHTVLNIPKATINPLVIGTLGAFLEPTPDREEELTRNQERLIKELICVLNKQLLGVVESRTKDEFRKVRDTIWPKYIRAIRALYDTISNLLSEEQVAAMTTEGAPHLTSDLKKQEALFGNTLMEQAVFTLWTIQKNRALAKKIDGLALPESQREADRKLLGEARTTSLWAQFHLDAVISAMKLNRPIAEEVRELMCDGLRAAVNAYAVMKEALSLRQPTKQHALVELPWDEEDERLLAASMRDINADSSEDSR
jgi:hypothetical protein